MKYISQEQDINIPDEVKVSVKARGVTVTGPRGELKKDFKHVAVELTFITPKKVWHIS